jgi:hypothetical protein
MLISETHFTEKSYPKLPNHTVYHTNHPAVTVIIKKSIKRHQLNNYSQNLLQATSVSVENSVGPLTISAVYLPTRHTAKQEKLEDFHNTLGAPVHSRRRLQCKASRLGIQTHYTLRTRSTQNDGNKQLKTPVTKGIPLDFAVTKSCFDLSSNHSPVLITLTNSTCAKTRETTKLKL